MTVGRALRIAVCAEFSLLGVLAAPHVRLRVRVGPGMAFSSDQVRCVLMSNHEISQHLLVAALVQLRRRVRD